MKMKKLLGKRLWKAIADYNGSGTLNYSRKCPSSFHISKDINKHCCQVMTESKTKEKEVKK